MSKKSEAVTRHRQKRKTELIRIMGGKCALCGYDRTPAVLELHHLNPEEKDFGLSSGNCRKIEEDIEEAKKCILLCANCHREVHAGLIEENLVSSFQPDIAEEVLKEYKPQPDKICPRCGKKIYRTATYCNTCVYEVKKEENLNHLMSRDELKAKIRTMPFTKIGEENQVSDNAVRKWCDNYHLPRTKKEINSYSDEEWALI